MSNNYSEISKLGEFGLIERLMSDVKPRNKSTKKGAGDDCALLDYEGRQILVSTDLLVENVHFDLTYTPLKHLGYKAAVVNFSDLAAMNAQPEQITVALAISSKFPVEAIEELYDGIKVACENYGVDLVGGDTTTSRSGLVICITVMGKAPENLVFRNGAKVNDLICVTGDLGAAYAGLLVLEREKRVFFKAPGTQPELEGYNYILQRFLRPEARTDMMKKFSEIGIVPTSMIDISDGLSSELFHICTQSKTGCVIYEERIPIDQQTYDTIMEFNIDPTTAALNGGEDYELLFTIPLEMHEKVRNHPDISIIGHITEEREGLQLITRQGVQVELKAQGWNALREGNAERTGL